MSTFKDFIPEGQDTDATGSGFSDFVKAKEPTPQVVEKPKNTTTEEVKK